jgi:hypothetical protein
VKITALLTIGLFLVAVPAWAKARSSSGASARPSATSECLQTAMNGRIEGECADDAEVDNCVGLKLALRNSMRQDQCRARAGQGCLVYSYRQNTQAQWIAVAGGYLAEALQCVRTQYGSEESNGFQEALADPAFRLKLSRLDDGASAFGLHEGALFTRILKGEEFSGVLRGTPAWAEIDTREKDRMLAAAEAPTAINSEQVTGKLAAKERPQAAWQVAIPAPFVATIPLPRSEVPAASRTPAASPVSAPAPSGVYVRVIKQNPYSLGLDLTLFERVSSAYQKRGEELQGMEDFLKRLPKKQEPRDVRELISRSKLGDL